MKTKFFKQLILFVSKSSILVGGQAVIEGVMMRVPGAYSTAVRDPEGKIHTDRHNFESITDRKPRLKKPVIRGAAAWALGQWLHRMPEIETTIIDALEARLADERDETVRQEILSGIGQKKSG